MTVPTGSLALEKFSGEVIMKHKSLDKEIKGLWKMATDRQAARNVVGEKLLKLKGVVLPFDEPAAMLAETAKLLKAANKEVAFLIKHIVRADSE